MNPIEKKKNFLHRLFAPRDLTVGSPWKCLLLIAVPIFLQNLFSNAFSLTNALVLKVTAGGIAVTAISCTSAISSLLFNFAYGAASGFAVILGNAYGAKDQVKTRKSFFLSVMIGIALGLLVSAIGFIFLSNFLDFLNIEMVYREGATRYFNIILISFPLMVINSILVNSFNAFGDTITSLSLSLLNAFANVLLAFLLTGPFALGTLGVGLATLLANVLEFAMAVMILKKAYRFLLFKKGDFSFDGKLIWELLSMGLPLGFQWSILFIGSFFQTSKVNLFGNGLATKATSCYSPYEGYLTMPISVIASAYLSFVSQNYGAKKMDRIKLGFKEAFLVEVGAWLIVMTIGLLTAPYVAYIFLPSEDITSRLTFYVSTYLYVISPCLILQAIIMMSRSAVQGMKKPLVPFFSGVGELIARILVCQFLPSFLSPNDLTSDSAYKAICFSNPAAWLFSALFMGGFAIYFVFYKQKKPSHDSAV